MKQATAHDLLMCDEDITALVADLVGRKYSRDGAGPDGPLSCWGLLREVYRRLGISVPAMPYPAEAMQICREVPYNEAGNAVLWNIADLPHVGVMVTKTRIIHAAPQRGVVIDHLRVLPSTRKQLRPIRPAAVHMSDDGWKEHKL